jgi:polysaccharide pyruvyl transferase WcaK-like protein
VHTDVMNARIAQGDIAVGMVGTFDVDNYGDRLFPLIAAAALSRRDPRIRIVPFSLNGKSEPSWPFQVRPVDEMVASMSTLSAMLVGGGQIVRFDKRYPIPAPKNADIPIAYWLVPALLAALNGKPVIWNAVGAWTGSPRAPWHDELVRQVFAASYFIGVRDVVSRNHLARLAPDADLELLPDTAFGVSRLWPLQEESVEFTNWRISLGLEGNYVVIQASAAVGSYRSTIESLVESMGTIDAVILPVCWCHGDRAEEFPKLKGHVFLSREWLAPKLISEIIGRSEFVFASSLHACITALSYGVPGVRMPMPSDRKYELLNEFEGIVRIDKKEAVFRLINRGRRIEPRAIEHADRLDRYWDKVADVVIQPPIERCRISRTLMSNWVARVCADRGRFGFTRRLVITMQESLARYFPNKRVALRRALSFLENPVVTPFQRTAGNGTPPIELQSDSEMPPVEADGIGAGNLEGGAERVLDLHRITQQRMKTEPYQWAFIDRLFSIEDAALLAASFPRDKFKKVKGYDGEKSYEYMSRSLIHMGARVPSHPEGLTPAWLALAGDLLSAEYRSALTWTIGRDLTSAVMEVNVIHYGPGAWMGPHLDLKEKIITHVLYFNETWNPQHGGCLNILRSSNPADILAEILPLVGNSSLLVRSNQSWHSVSRVAKDCRTSRRSVNVIFHLRGSVSTMWPPGDKATLRDYVPGA